MWPTHEFSAQVLINCVEESFGCLGGNPVDSYRFIYSNGVPDETCLPLTGTEEQCTPINQCRSCTDNNVCNPVYDYEKFSISDYGILWSEKYMKAEIFYFGTITCEIGVTSSFRNYRGGIFMDDTGSVLYDHTVSVVGWGKERNIAYWIVRNTWGTYWGEQGFARVLRGYNILGIESRCHWGSPSYQKRNNATSSSSKSSSKSSMPLSSSTSMKNKTQVVEASREVGIHIRNFVSCGFPTDWTKTKPVVISPLPSTYVNVSSLPYYWDIRNLHGRNYATPIKNQHSPLFCNSCWAQATATALSDRLNLYNYGQWPTIELSAQSILNCASGTCVGGDTGDVYRLGYLQGIPDETCQAYEGKKHECNSIDVCMDCDAYECWPVNDYRRVYVEEYGEVQGISNMKAEIYKRGPITCFMVMTEEFMEYEGGIFVETDHTYKGGHIVEVTGWGYDGQSNRHYWIARNNWGNEWGENGWFRIVMGGSNLMIETACSWGVPSFTRNSRS